MKGDTQNDKELKQRGTGTSTSRYQEIGPRNQVPRNVDALSGNVRAVYVLLLIPIISGSYISAHSSMSHWRLEVPDITREKAAPTQQPRRQTLEGAAQELRECEVLIAFPSSSRRHLCQAGLNVSF